MNIRKQQISKFCMFWLILLPIYQDSPLSAYLGAAGYSVMMPVSLVLIFFYILFTKHFPKNQYLMQLIFLGVWLTVVSFGAIIVWIAFGNSITVVSEFLPVKAIKVILQYFSYPAYIALILVLTRKVGVQQIGKCCFWVLIILTILCLIEMQQLPYAFQKLHYSGKFPYWRIRMLTLESSWTAMMIYVYSSISLFWCLSNKWKTGLIICVISMSILFLSSGSKSLMLAVGITVVIYVFIIFKKITPKTCIMLLLAAIAFIFFSQAILPKLVNSFENDIANYTSVATRLYTGVIGLGIGIVFPFGVGGAVYLGVLKSALLKYISVFETLPINFNMKEILVLATKQNDVALTVKSGILHNNMYWGIFGTAFLIRNFLWVGKSILKSNLENADLLISFFGTAIVLLVTATGFSFEFWLLYSFLLCIYEEKCI